MNLFSLNPTQLAGGQIALAAVLAVVGFALLLPRPRGRSVAGGIAALIGAAVVFAAFLYNAFGNPMPDVIGSVLFWLFSAGALGFGTVLVTQKNPARGAIAFAFVILSTCGLFLLLAATFLMAATIIIYAGAIIVTFLFVLMLSQTDGPSNENDRSREPWFGALAGFAFTGLVLFTLYLTHLRTTSASEDGEVAQRLPAPVLTTAERLKLADIVAKLDAENSQLPADSTSMVDRSRMAEHFEQIKAEIVTVVGSTEQSHVGSLQSRLGKLSGNPGVVLRTDEQAVAVLARATAIRERNEQVFRDVDNFVLNDPKHKSQDEVQAELRGLRDDVLLLAGAAELPARNVGNLGYLLFTNHLLAVELAGTLLLVATIGAISIATRKGAIA